MEEDFIYNLLDDQNKDLYERIYLADLVGGANFQKLEKILNPRKEHKMTTILDLCVQNPHVTYEELIDEVERLNYICVIEDEEIGKIPVCCSLNVGYYLKPVIEVVGRRKRFVSIDYLFAISPSVEKQLQDYCNQKLEK